MTNKQTGTAARQALLPFAFGGPVCAGSFKARPDEFRVAERLPFEADGEGPHWLVEVEKTDLNTLDLLDAMARRFGVARRSLGYSGLKDRFAVTRQYVTMPRNGISRQQLLDSTDATWRVVQATAHRRKLRVGSHRHNAFEITLREIPEDLAVREALLQRLEQISRLGAPNYFGPQRFGREGANLRKADQLFAGARTLPRQQHRFAVSAARSYVFNTVAATRVRDGTWNSLIEGEAISLDGSSSWFGYDKRGDDVDTRLAGFDIHPSGPLWGAGEPPVTGEARRVELEAIVGLRHYTSGLERLGLKQERRPLRQRVGDPDWQFFDDQLVLKFVLAKGSFATSVIRELIEHEDLMLT